MTEILPPVGSGGGGGAVASVSNSDGTLTITPTVGVVVASVALNHANTWAALQTFGNNLSFGGKAVNITSLTTGDILTYNGINWVNANVNHIATGTYTGDGNATQVIFSSAIGNVKYVRVYTEGNYNKGTAYCAETSDQDGTYSHTLQVSVDVAFFNVGELYETGAIAPITLTGGSAFQFLAGSTSDQSFNSAGIAYTWVAFA